MPKTPAVYLETTLAGSQTNEPLIIETNLTAQEKAVIKAGRKERKEHPENFTPWATIKAEQAKPREKKPTKPKK